MFIWCLWLLLLWLCDIGCLSSSKEIVILKRAINSVEIGCNWFTAQDRYVSSVTCLPPMYLYYSKIYRWWYLRCRLKTRTYWRLTATSTSRQSPSRCLLIAWRKTRKLVLPAVVFILSEPVNVHRSHSNSDFLYIMFVGWQFQLTTIIENSWCLLLWQCNSERCLPEAIYDTVELYKSILLLLLFLFKKLPF